MGSQNKFDLIVSYSQIHTWRLCSQKYDYKYNQRLEPKIKAYQLQQGDVIHQCLEAYSKDLSWKKVLRGILEKNEILALVDGDEELRKIVQDSKMIIRNYIRNWKDEKWEYIFVEHEFDPIYLCEVSGQKIGLVIKIDGLIKDSDGRLWLLERKSNKKFKDPDSRIRDLQTSLYCWGLWKLGYDVEGVMWDEVRTKLPVIPSVLKNGLISKRKNIDTDFETFVTALEENEQDEDGYEDILERVKFNTFFRRHPFPADKEFVSNIVDQFKVTVKRMVRFKDKPVAEVSFICGNCDYYHLCMADLKGLDTDFMKKASFKSRERRR